MKFFANGAHAIAEFEENRVDLIVSDVRMPGMGGGQLLSILKERWPATIRIILSGYADAPEALRLASLAHQYVAKPCNAEEIENVIERCFLLQELLGSDSLRGIVGRIGRLPATPKVVGDYEVLGDLGEGGMGIVYQARHVTTRRLVALKLMRGGLVTAAHAERFRREADTMKKFRHVA